MRARPVLIALFASLIIIAFAPGAARAQVELASDGLRVRVDERGQITSLSDSANGREYLAQGQPAPLVAIKVRNGMEPPSALEWDAPAGVATLRYDRSGVRVRVQAIRKSTHLVFEIVGVEPAEPRGRGDLGAVPDDNRGHRRARSSAWSATPVSQSASRC